MNETPNSEPKVVKKRYDRNFKHSAVEHWLGSGKPARVMAGELPDAADLEAAIGSAGARRFQADDGTSFGRKTPLAPREP